MAALRCFHQVRFELAPPRWVVAPELNLDMRSHSRKEVVDLVKYGSLVLSANILVRNTHCRIKKKMVDSGITTDEVLVVQDLSHPQEFSDLASLV